MRRLLRLLLRAAAALSLLLLTLLFLATTTIWLLSPRAGPPLRVYCERPDLLLEFESAEGRLTLGWIRGWPGWDMLGASVSPDPSALQTRDVFGVRLIDTKPVLSQIYSPRLHELGVMTGGGSWLTQGASPARQRLRMVRVSMPWSYPAALFGVPLLAVATVRLRKSYLARRRRAGHCPVCSYDLRATPDRCPECGHVPQPVSTG